jgi:UDP-2-acetamido-3-amino-2,3-dideoxy-glucuronate N-acetyltransferase
VSCHGGAYLHRDVSDVTLSHFNFPSGVQAHIHVSWLHPFKEQRLVVIGSDRMAVFDDTAKQKLVLYPHKVEWKNRIPTAVKAKGEAVDLEDCEPLRVECQQFLDSIESRVAPVTDGAEGLRVLRVLDACQRALENGPVSLGAHEERAEKKEPPYFVHESAYCDEGAEVGDGTKIWHFAHIMKGAKIGKRSIIGQNVNVDGGTLIGNNVKIQNNVAVYTGVVVEDDVFLGPSCVLQSPLSGKQTLPVRNHGVEARMYDRRERDDCLRCHCRPLCFRWRGFGGYEERAGLWPGSWKSSASNRMDEPPWTSARIA